MQSLRSSKEIYDANFVGDDKKTRERLSGKCNYMHGFSLSGSNPNFTDDEKVRAQAKAFHSLNQPKVIYFGDGLLPFSFAIDKMVDLIKTKKEFTSETLASIMDFAFSPEALKAANSKGSEVIKKFRGEFCDPNKENVMFLRVVQLRQENNFKAGDFKYLKHVCSSFKGRKANWAEFRIKMGYDIDRFLETHNLIALAQMAIIADGTTFPEISEEHIDRKLIHKVMKAKLYDDRDLRPKLDQNPVFQMMLFMISGYTSLELSTIRYGNEKCFKFNRNAGQQFFDTTLFGYAGDLSMMEYFRVLDEDLKLTKQNIVIEKHSPRSQITHSSVSEVDTDSSASPFSSESSATGEDSRDGTPKVKSPFGSPKGSSPREESVIDPLVASISAGYAQSGWNPADVYLALKAKGVELKPSSPTKTRKANGAQQVNQGLKIKQARGRSDLNNGEKPIVTARSLPVTSDNIKELEENKRKLSLGRSNSDSDLPSQGGIQLKSLVSQKTPSEPVVSAKSPSYNQIVGLSPRGSSTFFADTSPNPSRKSNDANAEKKVCCE